MWRREANRRPDWHQPDCGRNSVFRLKNQDCCCHRLADIPVRWSSACEILPDRGVRITRFPATCPELSDLRWWATSTTIPGNKLLREQAVAGFFRFGFVFMFVWFVLFLDCFVLDCSKEAGKGGVGWIKPKQKWKKKDKKEHWVTIILLSLRVHTSNTTVL